jgi:hypothetical protein
MTDSALQEVRLKILWNHMEEGEEEKEKDEE